MTKIVGMEHAYSVLLRKRPKNEAKVRSFGQIVVISICHAYLESRAVKLTQA